MLLNTKIQHRNFEPGEFVDTKFRSFEETIGCINNFPWENERDHIQISLTNPSVTIETNIDNYLKLALFYNGKFVLYFFNTEHELYTKSFYQKEDAFPYIKNLYESDVFDLRDFKKEPTWMQRNLIHFITQDFHYTITGRRIKEYLISTSGINFGLTIFLIILFVFNSGRYLEWLPTLGIFLFFSFFWGGGLNLLVFRNYYRFAKDKMLYLTKGDDIFYYGNKLNPTKYNKNDILLVTVYSPGGYRNPLTGFSLIKIDLKNQEMVFIPNIFVSESALKDKLYKCKQVQKGKLKFIKKKILSNGFSVNNSNIFFYFNFTSRLLSS